MKCLKTISESIKVATPTTKRTRKDLSQSPKSTPEETITWPFHLNSDTSASWAKSWLTIAAAEGHERSLPIFRRKLYTGRNIPWRC